MKVTSDKLAEILKIPKSEYHSAELYESGFEYRYQINSLNPKYPLPILTVRLIASEYNNNYTFSIAQSTTVTNILLTHKVQYGLIAYPHVTDDQIREAAYYIAEKDNFSGDSADYWIKAKHQLYSNKHI